MYREDENDGTKTIVAPNYLYYANNPCNDIINPDKNFADDLMRSNLDVGKRYNYCVIAVAPFYMAVQSTAEDLNPPFSKQSNPSCEQHTIQWVRTFVNIEIRAYLKLRTLSI